MDTLQNMLQSGEACQEMMEKLRKKQTPLLVTGCIDTQKCHLIHTLGQEYQYRVIVTYNEAKAKEIYEDYRFFDREVYLYPAKDVLFYSADVHSNAIVKMRMDILRKISEKQPATIVMTIDGAMDRLTGIAELNHHVFTIQVGEVLDLSKMRERLIELGYERAGMVDGAGQFAIRGGILDIFPLTEETPYRIELWGEEVDSIRSFDVESQRSIENIEKLTIYPAGEYILTKKRLQQGLAQMEKEYTTVQAQFKKEKKQEAYSRLNKMMKEVREEIEELHSVIGIDSYLPFFYENTVSFLEYFNENKAVFFLDEPSRIMERADAYELEFRESMTGRLEGGYILPSQANVLLPYKEVLAKAANKPCVLLSMLIRNLPFFAPKNSINLDVKSVNPYNNSFEELIKDLKSYRQKGFKILVLSPSTTRAKRLAEDIRQHELPVTWQEQLTGFVDQGEIVVSQGRLNKGFEYPLLKFAIISETDIFTARDKHRKAQKKKSQYTGSKINSFADISIGDYVVHEKHGLGIYKGIEKIEMDKVTKDYICIEYKGGSKLFILASQLDLIQKYASASARKPKLNKLGGTEWEKTKTRVRGEIKNIAKELVELYAVRQAQEGYAFTQDTVWQQEFEELFPYEETQDQLEAISATKADMESHKIMDRLICGDVGYGKTEVAIRAAFKAVADGKQVVFLVPTTILAQQHYNSFVERMKNFPVNIRMMSRFRTAAEQRKIIEELKKGLADIVIGTHRVLSKDMEFKDLGLLIIDEEQRFGVAHKEKIKQLKKNVDVLALSATPIPRTLHMSMIGIRDMSVLEEPPVDRRAIQTYVLEYNEELVKEAINRELARGGQVYYVYNRVNNIEEITEHIAGLVPEASVAFAHGQMSERQLERIMFQFINGELDVLVSTTIIETGLDISNVNTMIIHDANYLGLSQLYQLRGRVGRSNRSAYAFLMYRRDTMLKETAEKRLQAIREFTDLGSGFKIAMRDLEIRGAGNLLGAEQSGHMEAIGYDLYCKMLNDAVRRLKGDKEDVDEFETTMDLMIDAFIPSTYVRNEMQKLELYKRIAAIENDEEYEDMSDELMDRYGELPAAVMNLLKIAILKSKAHHAGLLQVEQKGNTIVFVMNKDAKVNVNGIDPLLRTDSYRNKMKFVIGETPSFLYQWKGGSKKQLLKTVEQIIVDLDQLIER